MKTPVPMTAQDIQICIAGLNVLLCEQEKWRHVLEPIDPLQVRSGVGMVRRLRDYLADIRSDLDKRPESQERGVQVDPQLVAVIDKYAKERP